MAINYNTMVANQLIKLTEDSLPSDIEFDSFKVNETFEVFTEFDVVLNEFAVVLVKNSGKSGERKSIAMDEYEVVALQKKLPHAFALARRYTYKTSSKTIDIPIELVSFENEYQYNSMIFVKENTYRKGQISIDIRKCAKRGESQTPYIHTKNGVRLSLDEAKTLSQKVNEIVQLFRSNTELTRSLLFSAELVLIIKTIKDLNSSEFECYGCKINHPSQDQHMDVGGCLREWSAVVGDHWECSQSLINETDIMDLADAAMTKLPNIKGLVTSKTWPIKTPTSNEKRDRILNIVNLEEDEMFAICKGIHDEN